MRTIFAEYNPQRNSIDIYTNVGYMLRIDCWEAEKDLKTTPGSDLSLIHIYQHAREVIFSRHENVFVRNKYIIKDN